MMLAYNLSVNLTEGYTYEIVGIPEQAIVLNIEDVEKQEAVSYDISGIPYTADIPEGIDVKWAPNTDASDQFTLKGTVTNVHPEKLVSRVDVFAAAYDVNGAFLGITSNFSLIVRTNEELGNGDSASFSVRIDDVVFMDVAFYRVLVTADFDPPKPIRR